jgi:polygalacturonase
MQDTRTVTEPVPPPILRGADRRGADAGAKTTPRASRPPSTNARQASAVVLAASQRTQASPGPLVLRSGVTLVIDAGATLYASTDPKACSTAARAPAARSTRAGAAAGR